MQNLTWSVLLSLLLTIANGMSNYQQMTVTCDDVFHCTYTLEVPEGIIEQPYVDPNTVQEINEGAANITGKLAGDTSLLNETFTEFNDVLKANERQASTVFRDTDLLGGDIDAVSDAIPSMIAATDAIEDILNCIQPLNRTVVFIHFQSTANQNLFLKGAANTSCSPSTVCIPPFTCGLPLVLNTNVSTTDYDKYLSWATNADYLTWCAPLQNQGQYNGQAASGIPMMYTTNDVTSSYYNPLNTWSDHEWMFDAMIDCSKTDYFPLKGFAPTLPNNGYETDIHTTTCNIDGVSTAVSSSDGNHHAKCGYINHFILDQDDCVIQSF